MDADAWMAGTMRERCDGQLSGLERRRARSPLCWIVTIMASFARPKRDGNGNTHSKSKKQISEKANFAFTLGSYPNPFNPNTTIEFTLPEPSHVTLKIYTILGNEVATLVDRNYSAGEYAVDWNARGFASGVISAGYWPGTNPPSVNFIF